MPEHQPDSENFNIIDLFYDKARQYPNKTALVFRNKKIAFKDFARSVDHTAQHFLNKGIQKGDRILVFIPMSIDLYRVVLAIFRIGATAVFLDEWVGINRLNTCCRMADCRAFVGSPKGRILAWFIPGLRRIPLHLGPGWSSSESLTALPKTSADDMALITFTTGSSGTPKAAIRTHRLLHEQFKALEPILAIHPDDICLTTLPIVLLINLAAGNTSVLGEFNSRKPATQKPEQLAGLLRKHAVNCLIASPFFVKNISEYLLNNAEECPSLTKVFTGGAAVFSSEARLFQQALPKARITVVYGSTEAEPISSISGKTLAAMGYGSLPFGLPVGQPEPVAKVRILKITDEPVAVSSEEDLDQWTLLPDEIGEIIVSGPHVLQAYLHNQKALERNKIFVNDQCWHRTGDSGYLDQAGHLFLTGRCDTLISRGPAWLSPFLYEARFQELTTVQAGTLVEVDKRLVAVVEPRAGVHPTSLRESIATLSLYFDRLVFTKKIPRDPRHYSKIDYERLKKALKAGQIK